MMITEFGIKSLFGFYLGSDDAGPAIVANRLESVQVQRQIFTAPHDLGRLFPHRESCGPEEGREDHDQENEANTFASCFLMAMEQF